MLTSVHLAAGAAVGKATGNLWLTILIAFVSHYVLDAIPHYSPKPVKGYLENGWRGASKKDIIFKSVEPVIGLLIICYAIFGFNSEDVWLMVVGALFGWLPDFLVFLKWKYNIKLLPAFLIKIEEDWHSHTNSSPGMMLQIIIFFLAVLYIYCQ